jgi:hypothetical protein
LRNSNLCQGSRSKWMLGRNTDGHAWTDAVDHREAGYL